MPDFQPHIFERFAAEFDDARSSELKLRAVERALIDGGFCTIKNFDYSPEAEANRRHGLQKDLCWKLKRCIELYPSSPTRCLRAARLACIDEKVVVKFDLPAQIRSALKMQECEKSAQRQLMLLAYARFVELGSVEALLEELPEAIPKFKEQISDENASERNACLAVLVTCLLLILGFVGLCAGAIHLVAHAFRLVFWG